MRETVWKSALPFKINAFTRAIKKTLTDKTAKMGEEAGRRGGERYP